MDAELGELVKSPSKALVEIATLKARSSPSSPWARLGRGSASTLPAQTDAKARALSSALGGPTIVRKGPADLLSDGVAVLENAEAGSPKRSGGQGDVLAGSIATLLGWAKAAESTGWSHAP